MADFKKIGRNNKNRGRQFEREVADLLGWTRVPYSGAIKEWGGADVVDGFFTKRGFWAAECKTEILKGDGPANLNIREKWIKQMLGGEQGGRRGILIVRRVRTGGKPGVKGPRPYVVMFEDVFDWFRGEVRTRMRESLDFAHDEDISLIPSRRSSVTRGLGYNFGIPEPDLEGIFQRHPLHVAVISDGQQTNWIVFTLDDFADITKTYGLYVKDETGPI